MKTFSFRYSALFVCFAALLAFTGGCAHKAPPPPPPPAPTPAPPTPTVTLNASPASIQAGQSATLSWSSTNATTLDIEPGVGKVAPEGSTSVTPTDTATYTITATGNGGTASATATVTVTPAPTPVPAPTPSIDDLFNQNVADIYFDFDKSDLRSESQTTLQHSAQFLKDHPEVKISIEGHCDERGSTEYNLGLGDRRAQAAKNYLTSLGITADRIATVSWGKEHPVCTEHSEDCWQKNRRDHFTMVH